jgi:hypothetical protein
LCTWKNRNAPERYTFKPKAKALKQIVVIPSHVNVTIISFTSTNIQGAFSGSPANNGEVKSVTNGKFNLDFASPVTITQ